MKKSPPVPASVRHDNNWYASSAGKSPACCSCLYFDSPSTVALPSSSAGGDVLAKRSAGAYDWPMRNTPRSYVGTWTKYVYFGSSRYHADLRSMLTAWHRFESSFRCPSQSTQVELSIFSALPLLA